MTCHPIPENHGHWWLCTGKWVRLHAVPGAVITREQMRDATDDGRWVRRRSACGMSRRWYMPSMFALIGRRRCTACCLALGIPPGDGAPVNENYRKQKESSR